MFFKPEKSYNLKNEIFQNGNTTLDLRLGDCLDIMPNISEASVDMILCDLPYQRTQNNWDQIIPYDKLWYNYKRILKSNGVIALFCDGLFMVDLINSNRDCFKYTITWNKVLPSGFLNAKKMPLRQTEEIAIFIIILLHIILKSI